MKCVQDPDSSTLQSTTMKVLILCVVLGVLAAQIEAFQRVTSLASRHAYTSRMAGQANDEMDKCRNSGIGRFLRRKGVALAITAGMLAGPRAAGARGFGRKGSVVEKPSEDVLEMVDDESDEYARASGGSVTSPSSSSTNSSSSYSLSRITVSRATKN